MTDARQRLFDGLIGSEEIVQLSPDAALEKIGMLIDLSGDLRREDGISRALTWCDEVKQRGLTGTQAALLEYFRANAWGHRQSGRHRDKWAAWAWEQPELQQQLLSLRRAVNHSGFADLELAHRCAIFTNLAGQLSTIGRMVEAVEYWDRALAVSPAFVMALGNRGCGLKTYADALYDHGHKRLVLAFAHRSLAEALSQSGRDLSSQAALDHFSHVKSQIENLIDPEEVLRETDLDRGDKKWTRRERQYRQWCLENRLFLNPLNELGPHVIAARDVFMLPSFVSASGEPPSLIGFFNEMKQEFASARWLLYEGAHSADVHFSDRDVMLYNTLDYPSYSVAVEKSKAAYRIAYSLFDKIGFFMNFYLELGVKERDVSFRRIWYENYERRQFWRDIERCRNWPARGLFWLSKDLFEEAFRDVTEPDARQLHDIRNYLEHKYLKIHDAFSTAVTAGRPNSEGLAYAIGRAEFEAKALRLLKLSRAALIYLSLGMHSEERRREKGRDQKLLVAMVLDLWDDDWKR